MHKSTREVCTASQTDAKLTRTFSDEFSGPYPHGFRALDLEGAFPIEQEIDLTIPWIFGLLPLNHERLALLQRHKAANTEKSFPSILVEAAFDQFRCCWTFNWVYGLEIFHAGFIADRCHHARGEGTVATPLPMKSESIPRCRPAVSSS